MILPIGDEGSTKKIDKLLLFFYINLIGINFLLLSEKNIFVSINAKFISKIVLYFMKSIINTCVVNFFLF